MNVIENKPLADARARSQKPRCNVSFLGYELSGDQTPLEEYISQLVADEVARQMVEKDAEIDLLQSKIEELETRLEEHQNTTGRERAFDRQRISKLENCNITVTSATGAAHIDKLHKLMLQSGTRQISITNAAKLLSISRMHAHRLKTSMLADSRFVIVKDPHHKQRHLIRII